MHNIILFCISRNIDFHCNFKFSKHQISTMDLAQFSPHTSRGFFFTIYNFSPIVNRKFSFKGEIRTSPELHPVHLHHQPRKHSRNTKTRDKNSAKCRKTNLILPSHHPQHRINKFQPLCHQRRRSK